MNEKRICKSNQCLRVGIFENGICPRCTDLMKQGFKKRKPIKKQSERSYPKAFAEAKRDFQLLRRLQEADCNGFVKCVHGRICHYTKCDAGHYIPANYKYHCFNPLNVHPQEKNKNMDMHNPVTVREYREFLIKNIGLKEVEHLEQTHRLERKYSACELIEMSKHFRAEIDKIKKDKN